MFQEIKKYREKTFVGHRIGTNFFDTNIKFVKYNYKKVEDHIKKSKAYQDEFERICGILNDGADIEKDSDNKKKRKRDDDSSELAKKRRID